MALYVKAPVVIEAFKLAKGEAFPPWFELALSDGDAVLEMYQDTGRVGASIKTPEGEMTAMPGDYVIRSAHGEIYPCHPDIFEETHVNLDMLLEYSDEDGKLALTRKVVIDDRETISLAIVVAREGELVWV